MIRNFEDSDIIEASAVSHLTWGDMYTHESSELQNLIYEFMVEYYDLNRKFSFSILDENYKGFLLAAKKDDKNDSFGLLKERVAQLKDIKDQKIALELYDYLEACGKEVKRNMNDDDVMLGLFVSVQKGCGKMLLTKLIETCRENKIKNIYLWTDTTCDYDYYHKNNFELVKETENRVNDRRIKTLIYKRCC